MSIEARQRRKAQRDLSTGSDSTTGQKKRVVRGNHRLLSTRAFLLKGSSSLLSCYDKSEDRSVEKQRLLPSQRDTLLNRKLLSTTILATKLTYSFG
jgi:hypothetical protein